MAYQNFFNPIGSGSKPSGGSTRYNYFDPSTYGNKMGGASQPSAVPRYAPTQSAAGATGMGPQDPSRVNQQKQMQTNLQTTPANGFESSPYALRYQGAQKFAQRDAASALAQAQRMGREAAVQGGFGMASAPGQAIIQKNLAGARDYGLGLKAEVMKAKESAYGDYLQRQEQVDDRTRQEQMDYLATLDPAALGAFLEGTSYGDIVQGGKLTDAYTPKNNYTVAYEAIYKDLAADPTMLPRWRTNLGLPDTATAEEVAANMASAQVDESYKGIEGVTVEGQVDAARQQALSNVDQGKVLVTPGTEESFATTIAGTTQEDLQAKGISVVDSPSKKNILPSGSAYKSKGGVLRISLGESTAANGDRIYRYVNVEDGTIGTRNLSKERRQKNRENDWIPFNE